MIAEAWDAAGLYQVGSFIGDSWKEWNGHFRDDVRSFFRGDNGMVGAFADRILGSRAIYAHKNREAEESVNFITCHDGFTLNDLVSYNEKHNEANGEDNRDGGNDNRSWNHGVEGSTTDPAIEKLRNRQIKNFLTVNLLSLGLPMITMGDEVRRTQCGNNNAYCHDDETTWFDWTLPEKHPDLLRFVQLLIARRLLRDADPGLQRMTLTQLIQRATTDWHGVKLNQPDWSNDSHSIALSTYIHKEHRMVHFIFNAYWEPLDFELPPRDSAGKYPWRRWIDTYLDSPQDIFDHEACLAIPSHPYRVGPRSVVVLWADAGDTPIPGT